MKVLALNAGSNTLRYKLVEVGPAERTMAEGSVDQVKGDKAIAAANKAIADCASRGVDAIGVRVVHGGESLTAPVRVDDSVLTKLKSITSLAPLHLPTDIAILEAALDAAPAVPTVAVFDTAFHETLPEVARRYALPDDAGALARRFGFHGLAHRFASAALPALVGRPLPRVVSLHLGGGASACAVRNGQSVDTSMGLTPLEGLVMSTRCGDLDPGVVLELFRHGRTVEQVEELLYKRSGLLGLSGSSGDIRDLEPAAASGDTRAELALGATAYRVRKYVGAYAAALSGLDGVVVHGALAENSPTFRARVLAGLEFLGVEMSVETNRAAGPEKPARLSPHGARVEVWVVPADEERQIARDVKLSDVATSLK